MAEKLSHTPYNWYGSPAEEYEALSQGDSGDSFAEILQAESEYGEPNADTAYGEWQGGETGEYIDDAPTEAEELAREVLAAPEEPTVEWTPSNPDGTVTQEQYREQCYWIIGQAGHALDCLRGSIHTEEEAQEWLEMKMSVAAAKRETDPYKLVDIRVDVTPIWWAYIESKQLDMAKFEKVSNK